MALSSYSVGYLVKEDVFLHRRVSIAAQQEADAATIDIGDPEAWAREHSWEYGSLPDWIGKAESAIVAGVLEWGNDPSVISDGDILSYVQPNIVP